MAMAATKISSKYQVVVPRQIRNLLEVGSGDTIIWKTSATGIRIVPQGKSLALYTRGLGKKAWENLDTTSYIQKLRNEWS